MLCLYAVNRRCKEGAQVFLLQGANARHLAEQIPTDGLPHICFLI